MRSFSIIKSSSFYESLKPGNQGVHPSLVCGSLRCAITFISFLENFVDTPGAFGLNQCRQFSLFISNMRTYE